MGRAVEGVTRLLAGIILVGKDRLLSAPLRPGKGGRERGGAGGTYYYLDVPDPSLESSWCTCISKVVVVRTALVNRVGRSAGAEGGSVLGRQCWGSEWHICFDDVIRGCKFVITVVVLPFLIELSWHVQIESCEKVPKQKKGRKSSPRHSGLVLVWTQFGRLKSKDYFLIDPLNRCRNTK